MRESLAAIGVRGCCFAALLLVQRAFKPRRTAVHPRNALHLADKQSLGLLVGFLLRLRRLAARVGSSRQSDDKTLAADPRRAPPVLIVGRTSLCKKSSLYASVHDLSMSQLGHYLQKSFQGSQTAGRRPQAETNKRKDCVRARATTQRIQPPPHTLRDVFH